MKSFWKELKSTFDTIVFVFQLTILSIVIITLPFGIVKCCASDGNETTDTVAVKKYEPFEFKSEQLDHVRFDFSDALITTEITIPPLDITSSNVDVGESQSVVSQNTNQKKWDIVPSETTYTVYITNTGSKYHRYGCQYLHSSCIAKDINSVKGRYSPCSKCKP